MRVHYFSQETTASLRQLMMQAEMDGVAGYVLDLRNDPGKSMPSLLLHQRIGG
jgi:C-terminal processing protease CtpA/Prc